MGALPLRKLANHALTREIESLKNSVASDKREAAKMTMDLVKQKFKVFLDLHEIYHEKLFDIDEIEDNDEYLYQVQDNYILALTLAKEYLRSPNRVKSDLCNSDMSKSVKYDVGVQDDCPEMTSGMTDDTMDIVASNIEHEETEEPPALVTHEDNAFAKEQFQVKMMFQDGNEECHGKRGQLTDCQMNSKELQESQENLVPVDLVQDQFLNSDFEGCEPIKQGIISNCMEMTYNNGSLENMEVNSRCTTVANMLERGKSVFEELHKLRTASV